MNWSIQYLRNQRKRAENDPYKSLGVSFNAFLSVILIGLATLALFRGPSDWHKQWQHISLITTVCIVWIRYGYDKLTGY